MDSQDHIYVNMEYCPEGDLVSNITEKGRYVGDDISAKIVFLQILDAVSHCQRLAQFLQNNSWQKSRVMLELL
jgi:hypothetical protein